MATAVIPEIIQQHAEEAAFLWLLRDNAVRAPHYNLQDLAHLDDRVEAHLDGLRISEDYGWELAVEALTAEESGEGFAAGVLALESGQRDRFDLVLDSAGASDDVARGLVSAFGWVAFDRVAPLLQTLVSSTDASVRRIAIAACAIHRHDPFGALRPALDDEDDALRARALRAVGELGRVDQLNRVRSHIASEDDAACRFFAARSSLLLGDRVAAGPVLCAFAEAGVGAYRAEEAAALAVRCMTPSSAEIWIRQLGSKPETLRLGILAAGASGNPAFVPSILEAMTPPTVARVAGEAFSLITGVDLAYDDLDGEWPDGFEAGPTEEPADDDVALDADEDLPWPDVAKIQDWWARHRSELPEGACYFLGKPKDTEAFQLGLRTGFQRQRAHAAFELAMATPDAPLFEVRGPGFVQKRHLPLARS